jgi:spoIIIJ-associated protein
VQHLADAVRNSGRPMQTEPLNSYDRRVIHNAFKNDPQIATWSPPEEARVKRITLRLRKKDA